MYFLQGFVYKRGKYTLSVNPIIFRNLLLLAQYIKPLNPTFYLNTKIALDRSGEMVLLWLQNTYLESNTVPCKCDKALFVFYRAISAIQNTFASNPTSSGNFKLRYYASNCITMQILQRPQCGSQLKKTTRSKENCPILLQSLVPFSLKTTSFQTFCRDWSIISRDL